MTTIAIIGKGKTGSEVIQLLHSSEENVLIFDRSHPVSVAGLKRADVAVIFIPGNAVGDIFDLVLASRIPVVWGSTGFEWPKNLANQLIEHKTRWVVASNFSPMTVLIQAMLAHLKTAAPNLLDDIQCTIHEIHHRDKKDQPSGTALAWQRWLGLPCSIHSERTLDVTGIHTLTLRTAEETLTLQHEVHHRRVFAKGALWAARYLIAHPELAPGQYSFYQLIEESLCRN